MNSITRLILCLFLGMTPVAAAGPWLTMEPAPEAPPKYSMIVDRVYIAVPSCRSFSYCEVGGKCHTISGNCSGGMGDVIFQDGRQWKTTTNSEQNIMTIYSWTKGQQLFVVPDKESGLLLFNESTSDTLPAKASEFTATQKIQQVDAAQGSLKLDDKSEWTVDLSQVGLAEWKEGDAIFISPAPNNSYILINLREGLEHTQLKAMQNFTTKDTKNTKAEGENRI